MLRKKTATPKLHLITNDDARRAEAQRQINRTVAKYVAIKVGVSAAVIIATRIIVKKMEEAEARENSTED